jgi:uncharacterized membrane protein YphA (DoxX/SURF4 family)
MLTFEGRPIVNTRNVERTPWPPPASAPVSVAVPKPRAVELAVQEDAASISHSSALFTVLPLRIFLAAGWLRAAAEKLISQKWWNGGELRSFLVVQHSTALPFFRPVMDHAFAPAAIPVTMLVILGELACGIALVIGRSMRLALYTGVVMNIAFVLCGRVNPSAFYLAMEMALLFAIAGGAIGRTPSRPGRHTLTFAGAWLMLGAAFVPSIRTIQPAQVIADPAIMITFLCVVTAAALVFRWVTAVPRRRESVFGATWTRRIDMWANAGHEPGINRRTDWPSATDTDSTSIARPRAASAFDVVL